MDQLSQLTEEFQRAIKELHPIRDHKLISYLSGEVQHLINRVEYGGTLRPDETQQLESRRDTVKIFKQFYAFMMLTGGFAPSSVTV